MHIAHLKLVERIKIKTNPLPFRDYYIHLKQVKLNEYSRTLNPPVNLVIIPLKKCFSLLLSMHLLHLEIKFNLNQLIYYCII